MWDKIFWGASRRFANDVSNIVGNEMKKKAKQKIIEQTNQHINEENSSDKQRASHLNRLKQILLLQKEDMGLLLDIGVSLLDMSSLGLDNEELAKNLLIIQNIKESLNERNHELDNVIEIGDKQGEITQDYSVYYKGKDVKKINGGVKVTTSYVELMVKCFDDFSTCELNMAKIAERFMNCYQMWDIKITEKYDEITDMNIVRIWSNGSTQIMDYNV
jgi:hypothetical protein